MSQTEKAIKEAAISRPPIVKHIAPPYMGTGLSTITSPAVSSAFWRAIRHDVTRGGLVVQLGAKPNQAPSPIGYSASAYAGFQYEFTVGATPAFYLNHEFRAKFTPGPVTVNHGSQGNYVYPFCQIWLTSPGNQPIKQQVVSNTPLTLQTGDYLETNQTYKLQIICGVSIFWYNTAVTPYGEVIIKDTDLQLTRYFDNSDLPVAGKSAALMSEAEPIIEAVESIEEAQARGLVGMF